MAREVWVNKDVFICGISFNTKRQLMDAIAECDKNINDIKAKIKAYIFMTDPQKFFPSEEDLVFRLSSELDELINEYDDAIIRRTRLWEFEESWDETHDDKNRAILPVNPLELKRKVYMGGDYMNYILDDGSEMPDDYWDVYHGFVKLEEYSMYNKIKT